MTKTTGRLRATLACLGLAAAAVTVSPAVATAQSDGPSISGPSVERFEPTARFIVEAESFTAIDESGFDWTGSDEIYAIWTSGGSGVSTSIIGDVDTGETKHFPDSERCIFPIETPSGDSLLSGERGDEWSCSDEGGFAPLEFGVWLFEHDVSLNGCSEFLIAGGVPLQDCADELIGYFDFSLAESQLVQTFHSEGTSRAITRTLGGPCGFVPPGKVVGCSEWGTGPEYKFRFRITRVADARQEHAPAPAPAPSTSPLEPADKADGPSSTPPGPVQVTPTPEAAPAVSPSDRLRPSSRFSR